TQTSLDSRTRGAGSVFPGESGRVAGDPDGHGILHGTRLDRYAFEFIEPAFVRRLFLMEELAENRYSFLESSDTLGVFDAHDFMLQCLGGTLLVGATQAHRQPGPAAGNDVQACPLLGQ